MVLVTKKASRLLVAAPIAAALAGCTGAEHSPVQTGSSLVLETFEGVLPCADCAGIRTALRLYAEQPSGRPTRYELTQMYLGTPDGERVVATTGRWTLLRGSASEIDATVYQLDFDRPRTAQNFLKVGDDELRLLDRNQSEISSPAPHSLHRVSKESSGAPVTLLESDAGATIDVNPGQRVVIRLNGNRTTGYVWTLAVPGLRLLMKLGEPIYTPDATPTNMVGAGGVETWLFQAGGRGREELRFEYRRPWERDAPAARTVSYTINVK